MKKILIDTNIILDIAIEKRIECEKSKAVLERIVNMKFQGYVTASSVTDIYYVLKKSRGHQDTVDFLTALFTFLDVAGVGKDVIIRSLNSHMKDFEDAVQVECARLNSISLVVTRNKADFINTGLEILTPDEFLEFSD